MTAAPLPTRIDYGQHRALALGTAITERAGAGTRVLLIADPALKANGLVAPIVDCVARAGHAVATVPARPGEPSVDAVDQIRAELQDHDAQLVVGLGGGSALDTAKLAAALAGDARPVGAFACGRRALPRRRIGLICLPTTAGTGAEATGVAVLADRGTKIWIAGPGLRPDIALLDPTLTKSLPAGLTVDTGIDAIVHAMEAATNRSGDPVARRYALAAIRLARAGLPRAVADGGDVAARGRMMQAAAAAGLAIDRAGTAMAHCIGHALASSGPIHHGRAVGLGMAASLAWCAAANRPAFAAVNAALGGPTDAEGVADTYRALVRACGLPGDLGAGFDRVSATELAERMADPVNAPMRQATVRPAEPDDLRRFAAILLDGRALTPAEQPALEAAGR